MRSWDFFKEMDQISREMGGIIDNFNRKRSFLPADETGRSPRIYPQINLRDDDENVYVEALLPGVEADQLEVNILADSLTVSGERRLANELTGKDLSWHRRERGTGKFLRTIELPVAIVADRVKAEYVNGLLRVTLPKAAESKPRKIAVKVG